MWGRGGWGSDAKKSAISANPTSVIPECPLSGARKSTGKDFGSYPIGNSSPSSIGQMEARGSFRLSLYAKYLTAIRSAFFANCTLYFYASVVIICTFPPLHRGKCCGAKYRLAYYSAACRYCVATAPFCILIKLKRISKALFIFMLEIIMH